MTNSFLWTATVNNIYLIVFIERNLLRSFATEMKKSYCSFWNKSFVFSNAERRIWKDWKEKNSIATIMDKVVETPPKMTRFVQRVSFSMSNFDIWIPSPFFKVVTRWKCPRSVLQHWKGGRGVGYQQKRCFLKLRKDTDRKRLFCSNVSTVLSMTVAKMPHRDTPEQNIEQLTCLAFQTSCYLSPSPRERK